MEVYHKINKKKNIVVALGFFDGIHLAHRKIIKSITREAKKRNEKCAVISFEKNPANYFKENPTFNIQSFKDKEILLSAYGVDYFYELNFEQYKEMTALEYLKDVIIKNLEPSVIYTGFNHTFGKDKEGTADFLRKHATTFKYEYVAIPEEKIDGQTISSTNIREFIEHGNLEDTKKMLGRNFSVRSSVIKGNGIARTLGFPTANLVWPNSMVKLPHGVYFGYAILDDKLKPALISWGKRPTVTQGQDEVLEAHILGVNKDIYGKIVNVIFEKKLRDEVTFAGLKDLVEQIKQDYIQFKKWAIVAQRKYPALF